MTDPIDIRSAWANTLWTDSDIREFTDNIYDFDINFDILDDVGMLKHKTRINAFTYLTIKVESSEKANTNTIPYEHQVLVTYYLEADGDINKISYNQVIDRLNTVEKKVRSLLGSQWNNLVSIWEVRQVNQPELIQIDGVNVWEGSYLYVGFTEEKQV